VLSAQGLLECGRDEDPCAVTSPGYGVPSPRCSAIRSAHRSRATISPTCRTIRPTPGIDRPRDRVEILLFDPGMPPGYQSAGTGRPSSVAAPTTRKGRSGTWRWHTIPTEVEIEEVLSGDPTRIRSSTVEPAISDLALRIVTGLPSRPSVRTCEISSPGMTAGMTNRVPAGGSGRRGGCGVASVLVDRSECSRGSLVMRRSGVRFPEAAPVKSRRSEP
jgi:hypothetical protein